MILDSSALIAILEQEQPATRLVHAAASGRCFISAGTLLEVGIVADRKSPSHGHKLDDLLRIFEVDVVPVTKRHAELARAAYRRFGRGSGHPARLNYGDCFSYALAIDSGESLLFVGTDFASTDVPAAVY